MLLWSDGRCEGRGGSRCRSCSSCRCSGGSSSKRWCGSEGGSSSKRRYRCRADRCKSRCRCGGGRSSWSEAGYRRHTGWLPARRILMDAVEAIPRCGKEREHIQKRKIVHANIVTCVSKVHSAHDAYGHIGHIDTRAATIRPAGLIPSQHGERFLALQRRGCHADIQAQQLGESIVVTGLVGQEDITQVKEWFGIRAKHSFQGGNQ